MTKILVVVDMQNDFIDGPLGSEAAKRIVPNVVEKIKNFKGKILLTKDTHFDKTYLNEQEGKHLPVKHCIIYTDGWELNKEVKAVIPANAMFIQKFTFGSIELMDEIKRENQKMTYDWDSGKVKPLEQVDEIEFIGLCTDICVINNAMLAKSWFPEIKIIVDSSCCAGSTPETHREALDIMKMCQIEVI